MENTLTQITAIFQQYTYDYCQNFVELLPPNGTGLNI